MFPSSPGRHTVRDALPTPVSSSLCSVEESSWQPRSTPLSLSYSTTHSFLTTVLSPVPPLTKARRGTLNGPHLTRSWKGLLWLTRSSLFSTSGPPPVPRPPSVGVEGRDLRLVSESRLPFFSSPVLTLLSGSPPGTAAGVGRRWTTGRGRTGPTRVSSHQTGPKCRTVPVRSYCPFPSVPEPRQPRFDSSFLDATLRPPSFLALRTPTFQRPEPLTSQSEHVECRVSSVRAWYPLSPPGGRVPPDSSAREVPKAYPEGGRVDVDTLLLLYEGGDGPEENISSKEASYF